MARTRKGSTVAAEAALLVLVIAMIGVGVFVGWIVGRYATPSAKTKTVTVGAAQTQLPGGGGGTTQTVAAPNGAPPEVTSSAAEFPAPNGDLANTRATQGSIDSGNVKRLGVAWTVPITASGIFGGYASTPLIAGGVVYTQDLNSNVEAIDLHSGKTLWKKAYDAPDIGPNGLAIGYGRIYGATSDFAFALDAKTGNEAWRSAKLTRNANEGIDMAPAVYDDTVYISTVPGNAKSFYKGNGVGVVWALDAKTGAKKWTFDTVPTDLWDPKYTKINSGGGLWHPPAFDAQGRMFVDIANPAPFPGTPARPWGSSRPGPDLYTASVVRLDPKTGKLLWHYQTIPHDVYDWDLQLPPVVGEVGGKEMVFSAGKMGYVYATDPESGKLLWKTAVGKHNGHDGDPALALKKQFSKLPKLPVTILPGELGGVETQLAYADGTVYAPIVDLPTAYVTQSKSKLDFAHGAGEMVALNASDGSIKWKVSFPTPVYGAATISKDLVFTTTFDGTLHALSRDDGHTVWTTKMPAGTNATVAIAGDTLVTAASYPQGKKQKPQLIAYRLGAKGQTQTTTPAPTTTTTASGAGGATAAAGKSVFTQNCGSCHTLGAAGTSGTVGPNLDSLKPSFAVVQKQVTNGGAVMPAFGGRLSKAQIAAVARYVSSAAGTKSSSGGGGGTP
jgi:outer membrane protein assembly factor BamB